MSGPGRSLRTPLLAAALMLAPVAAVACPYCAAKGPAEAKRTTYFIGAMVTLPFAVAGVAFRAIRRLDEKDSGDDR